MASVETAAIRRGRRAATRVAERLRRSVTEFLAIPIVIVAAFFAFAIILCVIDHDAGRRAHWSPFRSLLGRHVALVTVVTLVVTTPASRPVMGVTFAKAAPPRPAGWRRRGTRSPRRAA